MSVTKNSAGLKKSPAKKDNPKRRMPKAERRVQLLRVAYDIIVQDGIGALNMSVLAERSGAVKPIVYEHFENSQEVIFCIMDEYFKNLSTFVLERNTGAETIQEFLDKAIDAMFEFNKTRKFNIKLITNGFSAHDKSNNVYLEYNKRSVAFYKIMLEQQGVDSGKSEISGQILYEMMLGTVSEYALKRNADSAKAVLKQAVNGFLSTFAKPVGQTPIAPIEVLKLQL